MTTTPAAATVGRQGAGTARRLRALRREAARAARAQRQRWQYRLRRGRVEFDREVQGLHARFRQSPPAYHRFLDYGDAAAYREQLADQRARLRKPQPPA